MGALTVTASANPIGARLGDVDPLEDMGNFSLSRHVKGR